VDVFFVDCTNTHLVAFFQDNLGKAAPKGKTILDFNEARDDGISVASARPYANHLHLALDRIEITTPATHRPGALPGTPPTVSKH